MLAILSDIHANLEALQAVLEDIALQGATCIYCLGDTVGYGPDPCACLDLVATACQVTLLGNHDHAALFGPISFRDYAQRAIAWTTKQLMAGDPAEVARRLGFLSRCPHQHLEGSALFVHGSPRHPLDEYVFPEDAADADRMAALFAQVEGRCFLGHTHVPGVFVQHQPGASFGFSTPEQIGGVAHLDGLKALVNVGSVGQPRDGDWRACYALFDGQSVRFRRVEYDIETTARKIRSAGGLDDFLGDRLRQGR
jgi:diadenosine tetraphosphatase ApaH/serine/threonine PP2A family protein phosphatase